MGGVLGVAPTLDTPGIQSVGQLNSRATKRNTGNSWLRLEVRYRLVADLSGLPPAIVIVAEYDPLRDEGVDLVRRMKHAGVAVQMIDCARQIHPVFGHAPVIDACDAYLRQAARAAGRLITNKTQSCSG